jgi:hypothetical protein
MRRLRIEGADRLWDWELRNRSLYSRHEALKNSLRTPGRSKSFHAPVRIASW